MFDIFFPPSRGCASCLPTQRPSQHAAVTHGNSAFRLVRETTQFLHSVTLRQSRGESNPEPVHLVNCHNRSLPVAQWQFSYDGQRRRLPNWKTGRKSSRLKAPVTQCLWQLTANSFDLLSASVACEVVTCVRLVPPADEANCKHWFTTSFLQPLPSLITP